jgi:hypothetical protein
VVTEIFAAAVSRRARTGFGVPATIIERALSRTRNRVSTGPCAA